MFSKWTKALSYISTEGAVISALMYVVFTLYRPLNQSDTIAWQLSQACETSMMDLHADGPD